MDFSTQPDWWMTDEYTIDSPDLLPSAATVPVFGEKTQPGWGLEGKLDTETGVRAPGFMENYRKGRMNPRITAHAYKRGKPFAYVMRSVPMICIDVDGKNGGFASMPQLGYLPPTLAETSKSGNGYHLFYITGEPWDDELGYAQYDDRIGIATGIDIRATGCVYHHATQRWNGRPAVPLPSFLATKLRENKERRTAQKLALESMEEMDMDDVLVAQHELVKELEKPIAPGKRNNTLFAIGSQLKLATVNDWEALVYDRAVALGLSGDEASKLVNNIAAYGS